MTDHHPPGFHALVNALWAVVQFHTNGSADKSAATNCAVNACLVVAENLMHEDGDSAEQIAKFLEKSAEVVRANRHVFDGPSSKKEDTGDDPNVSPF